MSEIKIAVEIASTNSERIMGLMYRPELPTDKGMLFIFDQASNHSFWNKNVNFDLSLGFFDEQGILVAIRDMASQSPIPTSSNSNKIKFVLEMNKGFFNKKNINVGSRIVGIKKIDVKEGSLIDRNNYKIKDSYDFSHYLEIEPV